MQHVKPLCVTKINVYERQLREEKREKADVESAELLIGRKIL